MAMMCLAEPWNATFLVSSDITCNKQKIHAVIDIVVLDVRKSIQVYINTSIY